MKITLHIPLALAGIAAMAIAASPAVASHKKVPKAASFGGISSQDGPVVMQLPKGRRKATVTASWVYKCTSGDAPVYWTGFSVRVSKKGTFNVSSSRPRIFDDGSTMLESYTLSGKLTKSGASGKLKVHSTWFDASQKLTDECDSSTFTFRLYDGNTYAGTTSDGAPVVMTVSPDRDRFTGLSLPWLADCKSGMGVWGNANLGGPITSLGGFGGTLTKNVDFGDGTHADETQTLSGNVNARSVVGTWQVQANVLDSNGTSTDTCDSGQVKFRLV